MDNQPRFCTNCGQPLANGVAFCVACGMQVSTPLTGGLGYPPPYAQAPPQDDPLLVGLAAGYLANRRGRHPRLRAR